MMRLPYVCALAAPLLASSCRTPAVWPPVGRVCDATGPTSGRVTWQLSDSLGGTRPHDAQVARWLTGTWHITQVATEGVEAPTVEQWRLRLVPTDAWMQERLREAWVYGRGGTHPAIGARLTGGASLDTAAAARGALLHGPDAALAYWRSGSGHLTIDVPPGRQDQGGEGFRVLIATDDEFIGRFEWTGIAVGWVRRGEVTTFERWGGFFCARRVRDPRAPD